MRFEKTVGDLNIVSGVSPRDIGLYELLDVMLDLFMDVRTETGKELSELEVGDEAAAKWIAVAKALLSIPIDTSTLNMTKRRAERLNDLRDDLRSKEKDVKKAEKQTAGLLQEEKQLRERLDACNTTYEKLKEAQQTVQRYQDEIEQLEADIAMMNKIDHTAVTERRNQLLKAKEDQTKRLEVYNDYARKLDTVLGELEQTNKSIAELNSKLAQAKEQQQKNEQTLREKNEELQQQQAKNAEKLAQLNAEATQQNEQLVQQQELLASKSEELRRSGDLLENLVKKNAALKAEAVRIQAETEEQQRLDAEAEEKITGLKNALVKEKEHLNQTEQMLQTLNSEHKHLKWEIEALKERKAAFEKEYTEQQETKQSLEYTIAKKQEDINGCNSALAQMRLRAEQKAKELAELNEERAIAEQAYNEAQTEEAELQANIESLRTELAGVNSRIASASADESEINAKLAVQQEELQEKIDAQNESIKLIQAEIDKLTTRLNGVDEVCATLSSEKEAVEARCNEKQDEITSLHQEISRLRKEEELLKQEGETCEIEIKRGEDKLSELHEAIEAYKVFFNSDECKRTQQEINRLERISNLYQEGIKSMFGGMSPPVEHLGNFRADFDNRKKQLKNEIAQVRASLNGLSKDYLDVVARIEREVS